jgi:hypothetical protein
MATIPSGLLQQTAVLGISVATPGPGGGQSLALNLTVVSPGQVSTTNNPQVAQYSFNSPRDATMSVEFGPDTNYGLHTWSQPTPTGGGQVVILVAGMSSNVTYHMRATVTFPDGTQYIDSDHSFLTGGLPPARVAQITVTNPNGLTPSPGILLGHLWPGKTNQINTAALDEQGNLIWYYDPGVANEPYPVKLLPNGHMIAYF